MLFIIDIFFYNPHCTRNFSPNAQTH